MDAVRPAGRQAAAESPVATGASMPRRICAFGVLLAVGFCAAALAQDPPPSPPKEDLSQSQLQLLRDFERFEKALYDVAEFSRRTDPDQAELLYRARSQSQEQRILDEMRLLADTLKPQAGGKVVIGDTPEKQAEVIARLQTLLKVLQSADERDRLAREIERIQDLLKGTNALIGKQRDVRSDTGRGGDPKQLSEREKKLIEEAEKLARKIDQQDAERRGENSQPKPGEKLPGDSGEPKPGESPKDQKPGENKPGETPKPGEQSPGEQKPGEQKPGESKPGEQKPGDPAPNPPMEPKAGEKSPPMPEKGGDSQPMPPSGDQKDGGQQKESKPGEAPPMPGQSPMESQPGQQQDSQQQQKGQKPQELGQPQRAGQQQPSSEPKDDQQSRRTPGREELEEAREQMQKALEELDRQNREGSQEAQQEALTQLEKVKARLEAILRQLREEEDELLLASLEARFQKLRKLQMQVNVETVRIAKTANADKARHDDRAVALSRDEREIVLEAEKALSLLKEEGSSVAFPEAIEQMRDNMVSVGDRLNKGDTGSTTQVIEELIVETLDEMILAMQQEMERKKDQNQQQQQQKQQQQDDQQALINELAELKMIRSLQNQINRLTRQIGRELDGEQASDPDLRKMTDDLSRRQKRLQDATYDLSTGKNR
jgi:hypothetical protein